MTAPFWLVETSLRVSAATVLFLAARPLLRRAIGNRAVAWLWLPLTLRLLLPWPVQSPWGWLVSAPLATAAPAIPVTTRISVGPGAGAGTAAKAALPRRPASGGEEWLALWAAGAIVCVGRLACGWGQTRRWVAQASAGGPPLERAFASLPASLRRGVSVRVTDATDAPALTGLWRPQIWLPRTCLELLDDEQLRCVLWHEVGHARRRDLLAQALMELACCAHWFNPLAWVAARQARIDRELACDAWVLAHGNESPSRYGHTLIHVVQALRATYRPLHGSVAMAAGKRNLSLRVREIGAFRPRPAWRGAAALAAAWGAVAMATVTRGEPAAAAAAPVATASAPPSPSPASDGAEKPASRRQLQVEAKILAVPESALKTLLMEKARFGAQRAIIEQWAEIFRRRKGPSNIQQVSAVGANFQPLLTRLQEIQGVSTVAAPRVTFKPGQKASVEIMRELSYPIEFTDDQLPGMTATRTPKKFETRSMGFGLNVEGEFNPDQATLAFAMDWKLTDLQEYVRASDHQPVTVDPAEPRDAAPVFVLHSISTKLDLTPGSTVVVSGLREKPVLWSVFKYANADDPGSPAVLLGFITVKAIEPEGPPTAFTAADVSALRARLAQPPPPTGPSLAAAAPADAAPFGAPAPEKPGFILSPYAPDAGFVDVRGLKPGTEIRDPFTGNVVLSRNAGN